MLQNTKSEDSKFPNANGDDYFSPAAENNPTVGTTGLTDEVRARYEQVQAEINAMIQLEEEKERNKGGVAKADDLWLPL